MKCISGLTITSVNYLHLGMTFRTAGCLGPEDFNCSNMAASSEERIRGAGLSQGGKGPGEGGSPPLVGRYMGCKALSLSFLPEK